jgi:hypothetical protein
VRLYVYSRTAADATVQTFTGPQIEASITPSWTSFSMTTTACGVDTDHLYCQYTVSGIDTGDSFTLDVDDVVIKKV